MPVAGLVAAEMAAIRDANRRLPPPSKPATSELLPAPTTSCTACS
jgi:hypothetical protein